MTARAVGWLALALLCAAAPGVEWTKRYDGGVGNDRPAAIAMSLEGVPYVTGRFIDSDTSYNFGSIKYNPADGESTVSSYGFLYYPLMPLDDEGLAIAVNGSSFACAAGYTTDTAVIEDGEDEDTVEIPQFTTIRYNSSMQIQWSRFRKRVSDAATGCANAIACRGDTVAVTGCITGVDEDELDNLLTIEYAPNGDSLWACEYNNAGVDMADMGIACRYDAGGNLYVGGSSAGGDNLPDYLIMRHRPNGAVHWIRRYSSGQNRSDVLKGLCVNPATGRVFVTGSTGFGITTVSYDTVGGQTWFSDYNYGPLNGTDNAKAIGFSPDSWVYVVGTSPGQGTGKDYVTIKYHPSSGETAWVRRFDGPASGDDEPAAIAFDDEGCVYVSGYATRNTTGKDYCTVKYSPSGDAMDTWYYDGYAGDDVATGVAVDTGRNVYVTGYSVGTSNEDIVTMRCEQKPCSVDVGVKEIPEPASSIEVYSTVRPSARVYASAHPVQDSFYVVFTIGAYRDSQWIWLDSCEERTITFSPWLVQETGFLTATCLVRVDDDDAGNDCKYKAVDVKSGWKEVRSVPDGTKEVKDGGWLAYDPTDSVIYEAKGNKTNEFYRYNPKQNAWVTTLKGIPAGAEGKLPQKGCAGCVDPAGFVYMTKGNNTLGFWRYDVAEDTWIPRQNVPLGGGKKVKGGTSLAWAEVGGRDYVYLLKGYKNEFYRYDTLKDSWYLRASAPGGISVKYDKGSFIVNDGDSIIYAAKAKYNELWKYNIAKDSWVRQLAGMPFYGATGRKKKSKDGGSGALLGGYIYALKGGNTNEFWRYSIAADSWREMDTLPTYGSTNRKRLVKDGGSLASDGRVLFALKGNKCLEFWRYVPSGLTTEFGACASYSGGRVGSGGFSGESGLSDGVEATSPPRWNVDGSAVCYCREAEDGNGAGFEQVFVVYANQPNVELRAADIAMDCFDPVFDPSCENLCFVVDDTATERLQLATVPVPEADAGGIKPQASSFRLRNGRGPSSSTSASWSRELETRDQKLVQVRTVASGALALSRGKATPAGSFGATLITSSKWDHYGPASFSPTGDLIYYSRDDSANRTQAYVISAQGGTETALTDFSDADVEDVSFLDDEHVVFIYSEDGEYDRVAKLDVNTHELDILSDGDYDAETPDASYDGNWVTFSALGDNGAYQVGMVNADGSGEDLITSSSKDLEAPDWSGDGVSIAVSREATTIGMVDAGSGDFTPLTDSGETVLRELPDAYWNELGAQNLVVYTRENLSGSDGSRPRPPRRLGTGIFLVKHRKPHDGPMGAGLATLLRRGSSNPARGRVSVFWQVAAPGTKATVRVYDAAGRQVKELFSGKAPAGLTEAVWTCSDQKGRKVATGIYFCTLENGEKRISRKVVLAE